MRIGPDWARVARMMPGAARTALVAAMPLRTVRRDADVPEFRVRFVMSIPLFSHWPLEGLVPAGRMLASEHLAVDVDPPIPERLIEFVPVSLASRVRQIDLRVDDLFLVLASRPADWPTA